MPPFAVVLVLLALTLTVLSIAGKVPIWAAVLVLVVIDLLSVLPR